MKLWVDDIYFEPTEESTIFQFCSSKGINLPCFCYHEKLTIAGNCRICLVEANNALVVSCAMPILDNMRIFTNSKRARKARESVMEFLLVNHPLDCPICDQGGECDLQDISLTFGSDRGRFYEYNKRSVDNLYCGPLIKTVMTRCIHCTRCVRFITEISGAFDFGVLGRGNSMEIGTYIEKFLFDELSANIIDLCPVGALTSMPYAFSARPWELSNFEGIDIFDSLASSVSLSIANNRIVRIVPVLEESINEEWITNKARFAFDSLSIQRLNYPKLRLNNKLIGLSWPTSFDLFLTFLLSKPLLMVDCVLGHFIDLETAIALKDFFNGLGCSSLSLEDSFMFSSDLRISYLLNTTVVSLEHSSIFLLFGTNLRTEIPLLNSRLRKNYLFVNKQLVVYSIGLSIDYLTFPVKNLGNSIYYLKSFLEGNSIILKDLLFQKFVNPIFFGIQFNHTIKAKIFLGVALLSRFDGSSVLNALSQVLYKLFTFSKNYICLSIISPYLGRITASELGLSFNIQPFLKYTDFSFAYFCGVNNYLPIRKSKRIFSVYQGLFRNTTFLFNNANLILPTTSYTERVATYMNIEGRIRRIKKAIVPFKFLFTEFDIVKGLFFIKKKKIRHNFSILKNFYFLSFFKNLILYTCFIILEINYLARRLDNLTVLPFDFINFNAISLFHLNYVLSLISDNLLFNTLISRTINNYYSSDIFSKNSKIMSLCSIKLFYSNFSITQ